MQIIQRNQSHKLLHELPVHEARKFASKSIEDPHENAQGLSMSNFLAGNSMFEHMGKLDRADSIESDEKTVGRGYGRNT